MSDTSTRRFPIDRREYFNCVGRLLAHRLGQIFKELGYQSSIAKGQSNGVDLIVSDDNIQILVAEILNFSIMTYLSEDRKNKIVRNLTEYNCRRLLIFSCIANEGILRDLPLYAISTLKIGYQLHPKYFYDFFAAKDQVILREVDSQATWQDIKSKIVAFLQHFDMAYSHLS
jgi:hypothetical protein